MFFHLADVELYGAFILILAAIVLVFRFTWRKRSWTRVIGSITTIPIGLVATLILGLLILSQFMGCTSHGTPIYSPNRKNAALIWSNDGGALGGDSSVVLYGWHGLRSAMVFGGGWKAVDQTDVHWLDNSHVAIYYEPSYIFDEQRNCKNFHSIQVDCVPKQNGGAEAPPFTNH